MELSQRLDQIFSVPEEEQERIANSSAVKNELLAMYLDEPGNREDLQRISELFWWDETRAHEQVEKFRIERKTTSGGNGKDSGEALGVLSWSDFKNRTYLANDISSMLRDAFLLPEAVRKGNVVLKNNLFLRLENTPDSEQCFHLHDMGLILGMSEENLRFEFHEYKQQTESRRKAAKYKPSPNKKSEPEPQRSEEILPLQTERVSELLEREIEPVRWIVPNLLPEGLTLLAAPPKTGKSILCSNLSASIAAGERFMNEFPCETGDVLLCALEDSDARLQGRFQKERGEIPATSLARIEKTLAMNLTEAGGLEQLRLWLDAHAEAKLIIIDTLARVKRGKNRNDDAYISDTQFLSPLQALALEKHVAILLVHHLRKQKSEDPLENIHGSTALVGVADAIWMLRRKSRHDLGATLEIQGRDMEGRELALTLDGERLRWEYKGPAQEVQLTGERQAIVDLLSGNAGEIYSTSRIAEALGKKSAAISRLLNPLLRDGLILSGGFGKFYCPKVSND